ncbi:MAG: hypothetical protein J7M11_06460 [Elusimicrobia bacterium]|nr:hypothetical protein [Elusimicrobiota bacterium]
MRNYKLLFIAAIGVLAMGCDRMFKDNITFRGRVMYGTKQMVDIGSDPTDPQWAEVFVVTGPATDAIVQVANHQETAKAGPDGRYTLSIETYRSFTSSKADIYTIQAFVPRTVDSTRDEYTTVYGRPGDMVEVRPLLFHEFTDEDKEF